MEIPRFYPVLDTTVLAGRQWPVALVAEELLAVGVKILQYRHKGNWTQAEYDEAKHVAALCRQANALFVLNDRADFAHLLGSALHIGQDDLPPVAARKVVAEGTVIGYSTHNGSQLSSGDKEPVQYLSLGPIFATTSKEKPDPVVGLEGLIRLRPLTQKPLVAIGGITLDNAPDVWAAGADSVAVISGIVPSANERRALRELTGEWIQLVSR
jgi:thiamine-phosphate pyrophosphorylase